MFGVWCGSDCGSLLVKLVTETGEQQRSTSYRRQRATSALVFVAAKTGLRGADAGSVVGVETAGRLARSADGLGLCLDAC